MRLHVRFGSAVLAAAVVGVALSGPAVASSDEDAVRAVLSGMNGSYNRADFDTFAAYLCAEMREAHGFEQGWRASRTTDGPTRITVNSVAVDGTRAVANVRFEAAAHDETFDVDFVRENGWKACRYHAGQTV